MLLKDGDMRKLRGSYHVCFMGSSTFSYRCSVCVLMSHLPSFAHLCRLGDHHIIFVFESVEGGLYTVVFCHVCGDVSVLHISFVTEYRSH